MSELENIENVEEVETIPTDNTTEELHENVEQSTGEVSGEVSGEAGFPIDCTIKQIQSNITQSSEVLRDFMKWFNDWQFVELVFMVIVLSMLLSCRLLGFM